MLRAVTDGARARMTFTLNQKHSDSDGWRKLLALTEQANREGVPIKPQVLGRPTGLLLGHELTMTPFDGSALYRRLKKELAFPALIAELRNPEIKSQILAEIAARQESQRAYMMFELDDEVNYEPRPEQALAEKAKAAGRQVSEYVYEIMLMDDGRRLVFAPAQNFADGSLSAPCEMMRHPDTILGPGDGGAHCGLICDASYPTTMLSYWARDRKRGPKLSLPEVVKKLSADTAEFAGLRDRGRIAPGRRADLNLIDYGSLRMFRPEPVYDFPTGGRRVIQRSEGYVATVVNGVVTYRNGESTGEMPRQVVRGPQSSAA